MKIISFVLAFFIWQSVVYCQQPTVYNHNANLMTVEIKAIANQQASSFVATFHVSQFGENPEKAEKALQDRCKPFLSELQKPAIQASEYFVDFLGIKPIYQDSFLTDKKTKQKTKIGEFKKGVEIRQNIRVVYTTATQLQKIAMAAAKYEIFELLNVEYRYNQSEKVFANLRAQCEAYFKNYALAIEELGVNALDWERTIEEHKIITTIDQSYKTANVEQNLPIFNGLLNTGLINKSQTTARYYQPLPVENFDIVLNRDLLEPNLQLIYVFKVHFIVPQNGNKVELKNEIVIPDTEKNNRNNFYYQPNPIPSPVDTTKRF